MPVKRKFYRAAKGATKRVKSSRRSRDNIRFKVGRGGQYEAKGEGFKSNKWTELNVSWPKSLNKNTLKQAGWFAGGGFSGSLAAGGLIEAFRPKRRGKR